MFDVFKSYWRTGSTNASAEATATPVAAPGAFTISSAAFAASGQVAVTWGASSGVSTYTIKYGTATGVYGTTFSSSATSPTTVTGLTPDTPYYFMVTAVNAGGSRNATSEGAYSPTVVTPSLSVAEGMYESAQSVSLTTTTSGASIYYTTNGSTPSASSTLYSSAISVSTNSTLKAIAIKSGFTSSSIASAAYSFTTGITCTTSSSGAWSTSGIWDCGGVPIVPSAGDNVVIAHDTSIPSGTTIPEIYNLTINATKTLTQENTTQQVIKGTLTINGILNHLANSNAVSRTVNFKAANINLASGGFINLDGKGYSSGNGPAVV